MVCIQTNRINCLPLPRYYRRMAMMFPPEFPHDLQKKPKLVGEKLVYDALRNALDNMWSVFYDWPVKGTRRRVDFLCIGQGRGVIAIEVKGGLVHHSRARFRQLVARPGVRKVVTPFDQAKKALDAVLACCDAEAAALPCHIVVFFPHMSQAGFTFPEGPYVFTRENLEPAKLWAKLDGAMRVAVSMPECMALGQLFAALARP